ncbi:heat shock protein 90-5, chloroplastic-like [Panicum virgatum]|uniref:Histidine kinase/HSP90-like ATPase domain-containing protein n=1 Tax=Panicum virgatum TaxID=38727 RepID=A0A8T0RHR5_PANVG|nr:heat shock protein 90-5, chloroplastic-like [Panicum virgatum]KAG2584646.1 hypothetical protein PVAP13_6KG320100 [Panicum virgatum]
MAPALSGTLGASSVAALRPRAARGAPSAASSVAPRGSGAARCPRGVRWEAERSRGRIVRIRCDAAVTEKPAGEEAAEEKFEYQAEVSRLMDLIVHSLYSHKEVFLRELVSNASDALDKLRFLGVTDSSLLADGGELEIRIKPDPDAGTITITDTGVGMTKDELKDCLGTIAQSGTSKFLKALKENKDLGSDNGLIGQFGVGFYSAFLVAEKVVVSTKSPKSDKQYVWEAVADSSSYVIKEETDPEKMLTRGTQITLFLRPDDKYEFADPSRIQGLVKNYSQFVSFPIYTWQEKSRTVEVEEDEEPKEGEEATEGEKQKKKKTITEKYWDWELANETKPIWMRNPKEIKKTEYNEFYKKTFNEFLDPLAHTHFTTEGEVEFRSVLYVPGMAPLSNEEIMNPKTKNIRLYVKRVFISDDFDGELFPRYLSFVKGVVDSNDLPLNVSREILQESRIVRIMRKRLVRKTFDMIEELAEKEDKEDYKKFWESFGKFIKLGCIEDTGNHKRLAPLLRFHSSKNESDTISLDQYVENMPESQKAIYYIATDSLQSAKTAPFLEKLVQKDIEVLYLIEPIDEVAIQNLQTYKEKKFVDISKEDLELGDEEEENKETKQEFTLLCDWVKQQLGDKVAKVQISKRLSSSPCVLVSGKFGWSANMERLMKAQTLGDTSSLEFMRGRRIFEINPDHPIIKDLNAACKNEPESTEAKRAVELLYEAALISSGYTPESPAELGGKIYEMMVIALGGRWGRSDTEEAEATTTGEASAEADSSEGTVTEVIEPSEVRPESDPWRD